MTNIKLPDTMGELLELALDDAHKSIKEGHELDLRNWLRIEASNGNNCSVCLAGAVMLQTIDVRETCSSEIRSTLAEFDIYKLSPSRLEGMGASKDTICKLYALDEMRTLELESAWALVYGTDISDIDPDAGEALLKLKHSIITMKECDTSIDHVNEGDGWWIMMEALRDGLLEAKI